MERQLGGHLLAQLVDEHGGIQGLAQLAVVLLAPLGEVLRQVLIGVAPLVGDDDPDLLALELVAQSLERDDLIDHAHHPAPTALVGAVNNLGPVPAHRRVHRHRLAQRVVRGVARRRVPGHQRQRLDHRPVGVVGRTELQHVQQLDQPAPVVVGVRRLERGLHGAPVDRAAGLELVHQLPQRLLTAGHRRVDHRTDRGQLVDLGEHRFQADVARRFLDLPQDRRPVLALTSTGVTGFGVVLLVGAGDQGHDPLDALHRELRRDPRRQRLLGDSQRRPHDPVTPPRGGRLDALRTTTGQQFHPHLLRPPLLAGDVLGEPCRQLVRVRDTALPETQVPADLRTVVLDRPAAPLIPVQFGRRHPHLPGDELHRLARQLCPAPGRPAVLRVELQQHREAQSRRTALAEHERLLVPQQRPVLDQVVQVQRGTGRGRRSSFRGITPRSCTTPDSPTRVTPPQDHRRLRLVTAFLPAPLVVGHGLPPPLPRLPVERSRR